MNVLKRVIVIFIAWRLFLLLPIVAAELTLPFRPGYNYTSILKFTESNYPIDLFLVHPWGNFDGIHYLFLIGNWYTNNYQFFPLYPGLVKAVSVFFGTGKPFGVIQYFSALFVSNIAFLFGLYLFYKLIRFDYPHKIAILTILFLLIFPTSFFFASIYSEGLFFLLMIGSFYFARKKNWLLSGIFASLASITRIVGICILPAILYEFVRSEYPRFNLGPRLNLGSLVKIIPLFFPIFTLAGYAIYNFVKTKDALYFLHAHEIVGTNRVSEIVLIPQTIFRYLNILVAIPSSSYEWWIALLELSSVIFVTILLYLAWKLRVRTSYLIFSILAVLIPSSSGTFNGMPRYALIAFPMFISLALLKNRTLQILYVTISLSLLFLLLMLFSKGYFVA